MVRVWRRQLLGGTGMAMIVPGLLMASLAVLALAGGFGGLSALGQALSGPPAPASALTGADAGQPSHPLPARLVAALASAPTSASASRSGAGGGGASSTGGSGTTGAPGPLASIGPPARVQRPGQAPAGGGSRVSRPPPGHQPTAVDRVVSAGSSVTAQLPAPVGPAATKALQAAGATLDSIAPIKSP